MSANNWSDLLVERRTAPPQIGTDRFLEWMHGRRVFVSSPIDEEMIPARAAIAAHLWQQGAIPVMWEEFTPQDRRPVEAFLEGVEHSSAFVLVVGSRYGVTDSTGYSPTHKESDRAKQLDMPRFLFERAGVPAAERDGRLNDWIGSLYSELSGAKYGSNEELTQKLERQLRELASRQEHYWVKLDTLVFPGTVDQRSRQSGVDIIVKATLKDPSVRREISRLAGGPGVLGHTIGQDAQLTWGNETHAVRIGSLEVRTTSTSIDDVEITCTKTGDSQRSSLAMLGGVTVVSGYGSFGPADQFRVWADHALFGKPLPSTDLARGLGFGMLHLDGPMLPAVLQATRAQGWLAEGLARLYAVQESATRFGGYFDGLEIGPATAASIRLVGRYRLPSSREGVEFEGRVPLPAL